LEITDEHINLVRRVVRARFKRFLAFYDFDELVSMGTFGLLDAVEKYDSRPGVNFDSYAIIRIWGSIWDEIRRENGYKHGRNEYGDCIPIVGSLEWMEANVPNEYLMATIAPPQKLLDTSMPLICIFRKHLNWQQAYVMIYIYVFRCPFAVIADRLSITQSRVSQIHLRAKSDLSNNPSALLEFEYLFPDFFEKGAL
jgi:RNA polymerase sigma factor (sigma-70 family)